MMKLFKTFRKNAALIGITPDTRPFDFGKIGITFSIMWLGAIFNWAFFICEAKTFNDYAAATITTSAFPVVAICFMILVFQSRNIFEFIDGCEKIIENGE